jgi:hypothetical protein
MSHHCHATDCKASVPPEMWGCRKHWFMVPKPIRDRIWRTYRVGQCDDMNPSREYLLAAKEAVIAVAKREKLTPDTTLYDHFLSDEENP